MINENKMRGGAAHSPRSPPEGLGLCGGSGVIITDKSEVSQKRSFSNLAGNVTKGPALRTDTWQRWSLVSFLLARGRQTAAIVRSHSVAKRNRDAFLARLIPIVRMVYDDLFPSSSHRGSQPTYHVNQWANFFADKNHFCTVWTIYNRWL